MDEKSKMSRGALVSIVDDDTSVRRSTLRLLRCCGLRAEAFSSAEDFLQSGRVAETACLLLDMRMPGMDGLDLHRRLAETRQVLPIIFLSARASEERNAGPWKQALLISCVNLSVKRRSCERSGMCSKFQSIINVTTEDL